MGGIWSKLMILVYSTGVKMQVFKLEYRLGYYPLTKKACCWVPWVIIALVVSHYMGPTL